MSTAGFISRKIESKGKFAVISVAVCFLVTVLAISIAAGFRNEISSALALQGGDLAVLPVNSYSSGTITARVKLDSLFLDEISETVGGAECIPVIYTVGIAKGAEDIHGVVFKGVEHPCSCHDSTSLGVKIPRRLSQILRLRPGDRMPAYFIGSQVLRRNFTVMEIYDGIVTSDDRQTVFCDIGTLRRICSMDENEVSSIEIVFPDNLRGSDNFLPLAFSNLSALLYHRSDEVETALYCAALRTRYPMLFDWLDLIDFNVYFILIIMIIVAGFNMTVALLVILFRNIRTIGILKSLGMTTRSISVTFLIASSKLVLRGLVCGNLIAVILCIIQRRTHVFALNPDNYFLSFLPVRLDFPSILLFDAVAFASVMLLLLIPCRFIAKIDPATTIKQS